MTADLLERPTPTGAAGAVFGRIVAAVDGTEPGWEGCRQAARLVAPEGRLEVFAAVYLVEASLAAWSEEEIAEQLEAAAGDTIRQAREIAGRRAESRLVNGPTFPSLLHELARSEATLAVVGAQGHSRASEIVLGGVVGELLHKAQCSVLVARPPAADVLFPVSIVAGVDGSPESERALAAARYLARRFDVPLRAVVAVGGRAVDLTRPARGARARRGEPGRRPARRREPRFARAAGARLRVGAGSASGCLLGARRPRPAHVMSGGRARP
jgi:nucleotide-binding universal stress UspA family protein